MESQGINLYITIRDEHVQEIERFIHTVKERAREVVNTLPFEILPHRLIVEIVYKDFRSIDHFLDRNCNVNGKHLDGWTALHFYAAHNQPVEDIESLMSKVALIKQVTHHDGWTLLHLAVNNDNFNIVEVLITKGANVNPKDLDDWTP